MSEQRYRVRFDGDHYLIEDWEIDGSPDEVAMVNVYDEQADAEDEARELNAAHLADITRRGIVMGLRALAAFLESTPEILPDFALAHLTVSGKDAREHLARILPHLGEHQVSHGYTSSVEFRRTFFEPKGDRRWPNVALTVSADREKVCTPRIEDGQVVWDPSAELATSGRGAA